MVYDATTSSFTLFFQDGSISTLLEDELDSELDLEEALDRDPLERLDPFDDDLLRLRFLFDDPKERAHLRQYKPISLRL